MNCPNQPPARRRGCVRGHRRPAARRPDHRTPPGCGLTGVSLRGYAEPRTQAQRGARKRPRLVPVTTRSSSPGSGRQGRRGGRCGTACRTSRCGRPSRRSVRGRPEPPVLRLLDVVLWMLHGERMAGTRVVLSRGFAIMAMRPAAGCCGPAANGTANYSDLAVMVTVQADDLGKHVSITGVGLRARGGVPLPVPRRRERIDRGHLVPGGLQRRHPRTAVSLDPDDHPRRYFPGRQPRPARGSILGDERVQPGDALQPFRQPGPGQPPATLILELHIVVVLSPVVSDKQHPQQLLPRQPSRSQHPETPAT
jgi:hypothetical protein